MSRTEVSVKCRIGVSGRDSMEHLVEFVDNLYQGGIRKVIVHARKCILRGLSPAQNRAIPPLDYEAVRQLIPSFPEMKFIVNGGVNTLDDAQQALRWAHGTMIGRAAYNQPMMLADVDSRIYRDTSSGTLKSRRDILEAYVDFACEMHHLEAFGSGYPNLCKPLHNFFNDCPDRSALKLYKHSLDAKLKDIKTKTLDFNDFIWDIINSSFSEAYLDCPISINAY